MNKTKVIVTVSPATASKDTLKSFIINGADVVRINMSYATFDFCREVIASINEINKELNTCTSIMLDTRGPLVRIGHISDGKAFLKRDDKIRIFMHDVIGDCTKFSVDYSNLVEDTEIGCVVKTNDVDLQVIDKGKDYLLCLVLKEEYVEDNNSLIIPNLRLHKQFLNSFDKQTIKLANELNVDFLALSYVSCFDDVLEANDLLIDLNNEHMQIISKIENASAVDDIDRIIKASDGIMIERGDLSSEVAMERIPGIQKMIINKCHEKGVVSIVATELLSTMVSNNKPTKAEVSDIANAVLDGTDAVMLCGETTIGKFPIETLKVLERVISVAENDINYDHMIEKAMLGEEIDITSSIAYSVASSAEKLKCKAIFAPTMSGYTARKISKFRPVCPIIAVSPNMDTIKSLTLNFGVYPLLVNEIKNYDVIIDKSKKIAMEFLMLQEHDKIIITGGYPFSAVKHTNFMKIEEL